jgi:carbon-monoxide dehydrogenase small subunit
MTPRQRVSVDVAVNGVRRQVEVEARRLLSDFLRADLGLTGTHVGCEHGVCGACNVIVDGRLARSCLMLAAQADGTEIVTIEGLADGNALHPVQQALHDARGFQCGFCTPGVALAIVDLLERGVTDEQLVREELSGNLCRCTGYEPILAAVELARSGTDA